MSNCTQNKTGNFIPRTTGEYVTRDGRKAVVSALWMDTQWHGRIANDGAIWTLDGRCGEQRDCDIVGPWVEPAVDSPPSRDKKLSEEIELYRTDYPKSSFDNMSEIVAAVRELEAERAALRQEARAEEIECNQALIKLDRVREWAETEDRGARILYGYASRLAQQVLAILDGNETSASVPDSGQSVTPLPSEAKTAPASADMSDSAYETVTREVVWYGIKGGGENAKMDCVAFADWFDKLTWDSRYEKARATVTFKVPRSAPGGTPSLAERLAKCWNSDNLPDDLIAEVAALEGKAKP